MGWSGDVEVAAERFADHIARGRVIVGGSRFDSGAKVRIESDRNDIGRPANEWWGVRGDVVGASGLSDVGLGWGCGHVRGLFTGAGCETLAEAPWRG